MTHQKKEIDIDTIIGYIEKNGQFINVPSILHLNDNDYDIQKKELCSLGYNDTKELINLPTNLNSIFNFVTLHRKGVIHNVNIPANVDITYISSILTLLIPDFHKMTKDKQIIFIEVFIKKLYTDSKERFDFFDYKSVGWNKREFRNHIKKFQLGRDIMKYLSDYLHINIFVLDYDNDSLIYIGSKIYSKYKKNIFILKIDDTIFEPLHINNESIISYKSPIINKLINSRFLVERLDCDLTHDEEFNFIVGIEDISRYISNDIDDKKSIETLSDDMNGFEEEDGDFKKYNIADGVTDMVESTEEDVSCAEQKIEKVDNTYTVAQLKEIAKNKGIVLSYTINGKNRGKTKVMLIKEINSR